MKSDDVENQNKKVFTFTFPLLTDSTKNYQLKVLVGIPYPGCVTELCAQIVEKFSIPEFIVSDLQEALSNFIERETDQFYNEPTGALIEKFQSGQGDNIDFMVKEWEKIFIENTVEYGGDRFGSDDMELFSTVYHKLVHSPALEAVLEMEQSYATVVEEIIKQRYQRITQLTQKQTEEMCKAIEEVNEALTEADVTALAGRQLEEHGLERAHWDSKLGAVQEAQRRKYKDWLMSLVECTFDGPSSTPVMSPMVPQGRIGIFAEAETQKLQESFTIHLGSQLKQMYNIRILAADPLDFCMLRESPNEEFEPQPQKLQTALALYSNDLCGLVLLSDNCLGSFSGDTKDFLEICESSTELHFSNVENQLERIKESVKEAVQWRKDNQANVDANFLSSAEQMQRKNRTKYLQTGDVYITKHSNLTEVHVVFHLIMDDSIKSNDMNSRHPVILGLRNIIKCACSNDITTLSLPLLLTNEITPELTMNWCTKRAELVYKCVKGFMIEMTSWGGSELKNLQFLVPKGLSEEIFSALATMLPSIFRVSNPLVLKARTSPHNTKGKLDKKLSK